MSKGIVMQNRNSSSNRVWLFLAALAMVLALVAACSSSGDDSSSTTTASVAAAAPQQPAAAAAPVAAKGATAAKVKPASAPAAAASSSGGYSVGPATDPVLKRIVIANPAPGIESNNPGRDLGPLSTFQVRPIFENLIGFDADKGLLVPQLATSWSVEPDGISLRFKLREDVQFHNGWGEFTAQDVVYTHSQYIQKSSVHPHSRKMKAIQVEIVNDHEVVLKASKANAEIMRMISEQVGTIQIQSAKNAKEAGEPSLTTAPLAGTNAYQFVERTQAQSMLFKRIPYEHWRVMPDFEELEFKWVQEVSTRLAALLTEEVHLTQVGEDQKLQAKARGMVVGTGKHGAQRVFLGFKGAYTDPKSSCGYKHCDSPFLDVKVRKALNKAIDRKTLNTAYFGGKGQTMVLNHHAPGEAYTNPDWAKNFDSEYGYDPAAATALLKEAGYNSNNPLEINVEISTHAQFGQSADVLEAAAGFWRDIGVKPNLDVTDAAARRAATRAYAYKDHIAFSATFSFDIQGWRVYNSHVVPRGGALELIEVDALVDKIQVTMDLDEQTKLMRQLGDLAYPLHTGILLYWIPAELVYNPKFISSYAFPGNISDLWTHYELIKATQN
jgi:ABC-type transport system substrate-binding protein